MFMQAEPTKENLQSLLTNIAHKEFIKKPS